MSEKKHKMARKKARKEEEKYIQKEPEIKKELKVGYYKPKAHNIFEAIFSIVYLVLLIVALVLFIVNYKDALEMLFISMTLILLFGDSFHLIPRIIKNFRGYTENTYFWLGLGNQVSSITMTGFYFIMFYLWKGVFNQSSNVYEIVEYVLYALLAFRLIVCFIKENNWYSAEGNSVMSIVRNIPFCIAGCMVAVLFILTYNFENSILWIMGIPIILSFIFYMPVAIWGKKHPKLGTLMVPKTLCYIAMVVLFLIVMFNS